MKPVQQLLNVGVAVEIDIGIRMAVARQELLDPERAGAIIRANEHDIAEPVRDQLHSAHDESAHDQLAEFAVGLHQRQQLFTIQLDHFA